MYQIKYTYLDYPDEYELYNPAGEFISINYTPVPNIPIIKEVRL